MAKECGRPFSLIRCSVFVSAIIRLGHGRSWRGPAATELAARPVVTRKQAASMVLGKTFQALESNGRFAAAGTRGGPTCSATVPLEIGMETSGPTLKRPRPGKTNWSGAGFPRWQHRCSPAFGTAHISADPDGPRSSEVVRISCRLGCSIPLVSQRAGSLRTRPETPPGRHRGGCGF